MGNVFLSPDLKETIRHPKPLDPESLALQKLIGNFNCN